MKNEDRMVTVDQLDASGRRAVMVGFLWRGLVLNLLVALGGGIAGFVISFLLSIGLRLFGVVPQPAHQTMALVLSAAGGLCVGIYGLWQYIRWLFRVQFAGYRLRLVLGSANESQSAL